MASFIVLTYSPTGPAESLPCSATILTMALPTMEPSAIDAMVLHCSGSLIPNPMAQGTSVFSRMVEIIGERSVVILSLVPVTPSDETM